MIGDATSAEDTRGVKELQENGFDRATVLGNRQWGSWEKVDSPEVLQAWAELMKKHSDLGTRAKELLKYLNLKVYHGELIVGLERLRDYELDDEKMMSALEQQKEWRSREEYMTEPYYSREMKRCAFREGKLEIQRLLRRFGYDAEKEIAAYQATVVESSHLGAEMPSKAKTAKLEEPLVDIKAYLDFVNATKICRPSFEDLARHTSLSEATWKRRFDDVIWVATLAKKLQVQQSYKFSKKEVTKKMWQEAELFVEEKLTSLSDKPRRRSVLFNDNRNPNSPNDDSNEAYSEEKNGGH